MKLKFYSAVGAAVLLSGCSIGEPQMIGFCEDVLKERLLAPSDYRRVDVADRTTRISPTDWEALMNKHQPSSTDYHASIAGLAEAADEQFSHFSYVIEYDAPNAYGTPIRGRALCEYVSSGDTPPTSQSYVRVNGLTHTEWLISQLKS